jgi:hypothetical protein
MSLLPTHLLSPPTWRYLGLGLTTTYFALGLLSLARPLAAASSLGVYPKTPEGHAINRKSMVFLGIRDIAVASSVFWFYIEGKSREMGVLISSWLLVCGTDTWVAMEGLGGRRDKGVWVLVAGAVVTGVVGAGLLGV